MLYNNPPYIKIIKRDRIWQQRGHGSIDIHGYVQHKYWEIFYQQFLNTTGMCMECRSSKQHQARDNQILDVDCEWGGEERRRGENGLQLSRSLSNQQHWCQMELSNYSYFPAEIAREAQKAAQCWGDSHVSGSCSPGNPSLALWLLSVEGIRV